MVENQNTTIVRRWFEDAWNQRRPEAIDELLDLNIVSHGLRGPGATIYGRSAFHEAAAKLRAAFGEIHFTVEDIFGVEDRVAVRLTARLRHTGLLGDLPATDREVSVPLMCMIRLHQGRIVEGWNSWDIGAALGAVSESSSKR